jgi:hypothetical protein
MMVKFRLGVAQKLRLRKVLKVNGCRLRQLRARPYCIVTTINAFTGESKQVKASCVEELRKVIASEEPFVDLRLFHNNVELSDFDDIETKVIIIRELNPSKAIAYLSDMVNADTPWYWRKMDLSPQNICKVKTTTLALRKMDLLPHHVVEILDVVMHWDNYVVIPKHINLDIGKIIGRACVDFKLEIPLMLQTMLPLDDYMDDGGYVPHWLPHALEEIVMQRPVIIAPYVTDMIKACMVRNKFEFSQAEVDKLVDVIWRAEYGVIPEYVARIKSRRLGGFFCYEDVRGSNAALLDVLCRVGPALDATSCGNIYL